MNSIVKRAAEGQKDAFELIYRKYLNPIYRYIYFLVNSVSDAEDLTSAVFLKAFKNIENYKEQGYEINSWLYKIARNTVVDHYKKKKAVPISRIKNSENLAATNDDLSSSIDTKIQSERLKVAIESLSEDQQEVIILKYMNDLTNEEIAQVTDKTNQAVRAACYRGLVELKKYFNQSK